MKSRHLMLQGSMRKTSKTLQKGLEQKIPDKAKTLQNKRFAPKCCEAPGAENHTKYREKTAQKRKGGDSNKKSRAKPNTCKIKGLPRNPAKPWRAKATPKKTKKQKIQKSLKVFLITFGLCLRQLLALRASQRCLLLWDAASTLPLLLAAASQLLQLALSLSIKAPTMTCGHDNDVDDDVASLDGDPRRSRWKTPRPGIAPGSSA